jgi:plastocyanin
MLRAAGTVAAALAVLSLTLGGTASSSAMSGGVVIGDNWFCDQSYQDRVCSVTVTAGQAVTWTYPAGGASVHTVTDCGASCDSPPSSPTFDSGLIFPGGRFSRVFGQPGTVKYYCKLHPEMRGILTVAQASPAPAPTKTPVPTPTPTPRPAPTTPPARAATPQPTPTATPQLTTVATAPAESPTPRTTGVSSPTQIAGSPTPVDGGVPEGDEGGFGGSLGLLLPAVSISVLLAGGAGVTGFMWLRSRRRSPLG